MTTNLFPQEIVDAIDAAVATTNANGSTELFVDGARTDTYLQNGTAAYPYKTITAAITVANAAADSTHPYLVTVLPGIYSEAPFTINRYIKVVGSGRDMTRLTAQLVTANFITMEQGSRLEDCTIYGPTDPNTAGIYIPHGGEIIRLSDIVFSRGYYGLYANADSLGYVVGDTITFYDIGEAMHTLVRTTGFTRMFLSETRVESDDASLDRVAIAMQVDGADARMTLFDYYHRVAGTATVGAKVNNDGLLRIIGAVFRQGHTAIELGADASPSLRTQSCMIHRALGGTPNYTHDIYIGTSNASVNFGGFASRDRMVNAVGAADFYANFLNHEDGYEGACSLGELIVGDTDYVIPLLDYGRSAYLTGLVDGGEVEMSTGLNVIVRAGYGYINDPALTSPIRVAWDEDPHFLLTDNVEQTVYIDNTGTICKSTLSVDYNTNIVLAKAVTASTAVRILSQDEIAIGHTTSRLADFFEHVIGPLTESGCNVTKTGGNSYKIDINAGTFLIGLSERDITGAAGTAFTYVWQSAPGVWTYNAATIIDKNKYDNGTGPTAFGGNDWKKDVVYLIKNGGGEQYFVVMGQTAFADQATALSGALPSAPDLLTEYGLRVASIVTHAEAADIDTVVDIRPFLGQNSPISTSVAVNHNDLANRNLDNNHTQYHTDSRAATWLSGLPGNTSNLVTDGNDHDHTGGAGAQISHTNLSDKGTTTHGDIDLFIGSKSAASGLASLNGSSKVVQDPANATATPTLGKIPIADGSAKLDGWISADAAAGTASLRTLSNTGTSACAGNDSRLSDNRTPTAHASSHATGGDVIPTAVAGVSPGLLSAADKTKIDNLGTPVTSVTGTAPIVSTGTTTPAISISAATTSDPGSMSAADKLKLNNATATPTASRIVIADASAKVDGWVSSGSAAATPSLRAIGTGALEACAGDDSRLSNARTPSSTLAHKASHISGSDQLDDATGLAHGLMTAAHYTKVDGISSDAAAGTASLRSLSNTGTTACAGNDARLSDARTPSSTLAHKASHISGADQLDDATALAHGLMTGAQFTKLAGITAGAAVASVSGAGAISSSGGTTPSISIAAATTLVPGTMSAADKTKLDGITAGAAVASVSGSGAISSSGGTTPAISVAAATTLVPGTMSAADKTKLDGVASGATANHHGEDYQSASSLNRVTYNTNTSFQSKVALTTAAVTGTYMIEWMYILDNSATNQQVEGQLYNTTDAAIVGGLDVMRPANAVERKNVCGFAEVVMAGVAKTFQIQYRTANTGATVGIAEARIKFYRIS